MEKNRDEMPLIDHLKELRLRVFVSVAGIVIGSVFCFSFYDVFFAFLFKPFSNLSGSLGETLFVNNIYEGFLIKFKLSIIAGTVLSSPIHLFNILAFVFPALTGKERVTIAICLVVAVILSFVGFFYGYLYIAPLSINFLTGRGFIPQGVGMILSFDKNIFYVLQLLLGGILVFQFPIVLEVLLIMKLVSRRQIFGASRFIVLGTLLVSALLTPPDFVSQLALAIPLLGLYFVALLIAFIFRFGKEEAHA